VIVKIAVAGIAAIAAALGAGYHAVGANAQHAEDKAAAHFGGLDYVRIAPFGVPLIKDGVLEGYLLTEWVFTIDAATKAAMSVPAEFLIKEEAFRTIYGEVTVDFDRLDRVNLAALAETIRKNVNVRLESEAVASVLVQKFDYIANAKIRDNAVR
jgi:hypothetical protein